MTIVLLYINKHLSIEHDRVNGWLLCDWYNQQTKKSVMMGCRLIVEFMQETKCYYILTDNTQVVKSWNHSVEYVASIYFPDLIQAGLVAFAGIVSTDVFARFSTYTAVHQAAAEIDPYVQLFHSPRKAKDWLKMKKQEYLEKKKTGVRQVMDLLKNK